MRDKNKEKSLCSHCFHKQREKILKRGTRAPSGKRYCFRMKQKRVSKRVSQKKSTVKVHRVQLHEPVLSMI